MKRLALVVVAALVATLALAGCQRSVEVEAGTRVMCTYGHEISDDVRIIKVPARGASAYRVRLETRTCDRHIALEKLYAEAQAALLAGDTETARAKLALIVADDPAFRRAREQSDALARGEKPAPDGGSPGGGSSPATATPNPGEGDISGPVGALAKYVPDTLAGYSARRPSVDTLVISRDYVPDASSKALLLVIQAEQFRTVAEAKRRLEAAMRVVTPKSASTQRIDGVEVMLGNDGRGSAFAGYTDGAILIVLELAAKSGVDPASLTASVVDVVKLLP